MQKSATEMRTEEFACRRVCAQKCTTEVHTEETYIQRCVQKSETEVHAEEACIQSARATEVRTEECETEVRTEECMQKSVQVIYEKSARDK